MKPQYLTGQIENLTLNTYDKKDSFFAINFSLRGKDVSVLPSFDSIPLFVIPEWVIKKIPKFITLEVYKRYKKYYCYESQFWKAVRSA